MLTQLALRWHRLSPLLHSSMSTEEEEEEETGHQSQAPLLSAGAAPDGAEKRSGAVRTRTCTIVFSFTFADEQYVVVAEAHRTFAAEAPDLVDAHAVGADAGDLPALVDVCTNQERSGSEWKPLLDSAAGAPCLPTGFPVWMSMMKPGAWLPHSSRYSAETGSRTLTFVVVWGGLRCVRTLTGGRSGTGLTRLVPGFAHVVGAAAHLLGHVEGQLVLTRVVEVAVAHALPHVCTQERKKKPTTESPAATETVSTPSSISPMQLFPPLTCMYSGGHTQV